ncbi:MAG TPA: GGDEF domain-containing protein, partial [Sedimentisphaerales bacterium]|nr:GGDEF domain-containing protein [Sedimentisphaerales bacterium]
ARTIGQLHSAAGSAGLVLLARMYEEPEAIELMGSCRNGAGPFISDYLICPVEARELVCLAMPGGRKASQTAFLEKADDVEAMEELVRMATEDYLTGLKNRRYLDEFLVQAIERARHGVSQVSLLVLDIDGLKHYNDTWGHTIGDSVLHQAAAFIRSCCRSHDVVARIGGDEFAVVFWNVPAAGESEMQDRRRAAMHPGEAQVIDRLRVRLAGAGLPLLGPTGIGMLEMSGGLAAFPHDGASAKELYLAADAALLHAKRAGKNRIYLVGQAGQQETAEPIDEQK